MKKNKRLLENEAKIAQELTIAKRVVKLVYRFKGGNNVLETMSQPTEAIKAE